MGVGGGAPAGVILLITCLLCVLTGLLAEQFAKVRPKPQQNVGDLTPASVSPSVEGK